MEQEERNHVIQVEGNERDETIEMFIDMVREKREKLFVMKE